MRFHHSTEIWQAHPTLVASAVSAGGITPGPDVRDRIRPYLETALRRLDECPLSEFPEVRAWRRPFGSMGLKPTQYRCASESLLRRLRKDGGLPRIHPLVDLCNHISASTAIPIAVFDTAHISGDLEVRPAHGDKQYTAFSSEIERPSVREVIFADDADQAHARRWTNRQSATSGIRATTGNVVIVIEALHDGAGRDVRAALTTLAGEIAEVWGGRPRTAVLTAEQPWFTADVDDGHEAR